MATAQPIPKVLHCHSAFDAGGKELRAVQLINAFGDELHHTIISDDPEQMGARAYLDRGVKVDFPDFPSLTGLPMPGRLVAIAKAIADYDLVLTYNWGAMDVVMVHTIFADAFKLPPLIHHEDGFNEDEAYALKPRRNWYRRIGLSRASHVVVPSQTLEDIAQTHWKCPPLQLQRIANGIDTRAFARAPKRGALRLVKRGGEYWVGTLAGLRPVKQLQLLVRAAAQMPPDWHLVIIGDGPQKDAIRAEADALDISHRVHLPGAVTDPASVIGLFDIFALSSQSEQFPLSVVEAMAASLPVVAPDIGDVKTMVAPPNQRFIAPSNDPDALAAPLIELAANPDLRRELGRANRDKARAQFDRSAMIEAYRALYFGAIEPR